MKCDVEHCCVCVGVCRPFEKTAVATEMGKLH